MRCFAFLLYLLAFLFRPFGACLKKSSLRKRNLGRLGSWTEEAPLVSSFAVVQTMVDAETFSQMALHGSCSAAACLMAVSFLMRFDSLIISRSGCRGNSTRQPDIEGQRRSAPAGYFPTLGFACSHNKLWRTQRHDALGSWSLVPCKSDLKRDSLFNFIELMRELSMHPFL